MENNDNLILEHLRHIRGRVDQIAVDMGDLKHRMSGLSRRNAVNTKFSSRCSELTKIPELIDVTRA